MAKTFRVPEIGDVLAGKYRIEEQIGKGGFGVVFRATQIGMERSIALKTLLPQAMAHEDMVERFRREAILARNLNHPNTIRLYDFGQTDGGLLYIAMEYLDGKTLGDLLKGSGPLSTARVKTVASQVLKSLAEAHQNNIVHRDLKPANVFLIEIVGEEDFVKVLDFGIAKAFDSEGGEDEARLTKTGIGFGTAYYMAPEQVRGRNICPSTDLYALGLLMTECLTGETVYKGTSSMEIAVKQLAEEPAPIPEWVLRGPLGPIIQRATQKDLRLRYPSAVEMLRDLRAVDLNATMDISTSFNSRELIRQGEPLKRKLPIPLILGLVGVGAVILLLASALIAVLALGNGAPAQPPDVQASNISTADKDKEKPAEGIKTKEKEAGKETKSEEPKEAPAVVEAPPARVALSSTPPGAQIFEGETLLGLGPVTVTFAEGETERQLTARLGGFKDATFTVTPDDGPERNITLEVEEPKEAPQVVSRRAPPRANNNNSALADGPKVPKGGTGASPPVEKQPDTTPINIPKL